MEIRQASRKQPFANEARQAETGQLQTFVIPAASGRLACVKSKTIQVVVD